MLAVSAALVLAVGAALVWLLGRRAEARRTTRFAARPDLDPARIWRDFYSDGEASLASVETALRLVGEATTVPAGKLRPTDRFAVELAPERGWEFDDGLSEIAWYLESKSKGSGRELETVDDLVRLLDRPDNISDYRTSEAADPPG